MKVTNTGLLTTGQNAIMGAQGGMQEDAFTKSIKKQIENAQEKLQDISSNKELSMEEKMKKRQEIQKEITDLNAQLRQHQIELRKEKQTKDTANKEMQETSKRNDLQEQGSLSQADMQAMISADNTVKQVKGQKKTTSQMEGKAGVLEIEIKTDKGRGRVTKRKEEELVALQERVENAKGRQLSMLSEAKETLEDTKQDAYDKTTEEMKEESEEKNNKTELGYHPVNILL